MREFRVLILTNSISDLSKLVFPDFKILNTNSEEFKDFITETRVPEYFETDRKQRYAILNKDLSKPFGAKKINRIYEFLLLLCPSNLAVNYIVHFKFEKNRLVHRDSFNNEVYDEEYENFFKFDESDLGKINMFIDAYYMEFQSSSYLNSTIQNYVNALDNPHYHHFSFIALCISLESVTVGNTELLYRIRRNVAVICGKDVESGQIVFDNINTIYKLRSKIVHGMDFSDDQVYEYLHYLKCIVSKLIIELLIHKIPKLELLNMKITTLGFGDREKISGNWTNIQLNEDVENIIYTKI
ncbi:HEPN domain-containing protein [uncultured Zobellia sp.]|uniref:HEPN domain-containing protein n=1 Tax=uncultured Zobellia sp. TaxID=255433 RepID=UPI0025997C47|nr:HEPN domain-containing protein [uncultured Zobellia sp.]